MRRMGQKRERARSFSAR
ncbi:hypothetical protein [Serratia sp. S4]